MDWEIIATTIALITVLAGAILLVVGRVLNIERLTFWAKDEFIAGGFVSLMLIGGIVVIVGVINSALVQIAGGDAFELAGAYIDGRLGVLAVIYDSLVFVVLFFSALASLTIWVTDVIIFKITPFRGLTAFSNMFAEAANLISNFVLLLNMLKAFLLFAKGSLMSVFMPIGIALRAFPATKRVGGAFIAVAVSFYLVLPLLLCIDIQIVSSQTQLLDEAGVQLQGFRAQHEGNLEILTSPENHSSEILALSEQLSDEFLFGSVEGTYDLLSDSLIQLIVWLIILPIFDVLLAVLLAREMARWFGTEIELWLGIFERL